MSSHNFKNHFNTLINGFLILITALLLIYPLFRLTHKITIDYNEGWNALFSRMISSGEGCYQSLESAVLNNYPPLSFHINHLITKITGDHIISGRLLSISGLLFTALLIFLILKHHGPEALTISLLFLLHQLIWHLDYVGSCAPQWFAHAVMLSGLLVFLKLKKRKLRYIIAIILFTTAGLIKHSLLPVPLAVTFFLLINKEQNIKFWIFLAIIASLFTMIFLKIVYAPHLWTAIFNAPRLYKISLIPRIGTWLLPLTAPLAILVITIKFPLNDRSKLFFIYLIISLLWAIFISGGCGVYYNSLFDFEIALFLFIGSYIPRMKKKKISIISALIIPVIINIPMQLYHTKEGVKAVKSQERSLQKDIKFIQSFPEPVFCENLILNYWSNKKYTFDIYTIDQKMKSVYWSEERVISMLDSLQPSVIQLDDIDNSNFGFTPERMPQIFKRYKLAHSSENGYFFTLINENELAQSSIKN